MGAPQKISTPDFGVRTHDVNDLEKTLVKFIQQIFSDAYRLDNPAVNLLQPDVVPFDATERAQALEGKVAPQVVRGQVPADLTGVIDTTKLPDCPAIIVTAVSASVRNTDTIATVKMLVSAYDENPDGSGYQDVLNMLEAMAIALTSFGQAGLDKAYPIVMPLEWSRKEGSAYFPHFIGEMTTQWQLPSGRPMPDIDGCFKPAEHLDMKLETSPQLYEQN